MGTELIRGRDAATRRGQEGREGDAMADEEGPGSKAQESRVIIVKPEENPCPQCGWPMVWVSGGPRCAHCGFKESCCF